MQTNGWSSISCVSAWHGISSALQSWWRCEPRECSFRGNIDHHYYHTVHTDTTSLCSYLSTCTVTLLHVVLGHCNYKNCKWSKWDKLLVYAWSSTAHCGIAVFLHTWKWNGNNKPSWLEHWASNQNVVGSNPWADKVKICRSAPEQGSSPTVPQVTKTGCLLKRQPPKPLWFRCFGQNAEDTFQLKAFSCTTA